MQHANFHSIIFPFSFPLNALMLLLDNGRYITGNNVLPVHACSAPDCFEACISSKAIGTRDDDYSPSGVHIAFKKVLLSWLYTQ